MAMLEEGLGRKRTALRGLSRAVPRRTVGCPSARQQRKADPVTVCSERPKPQHADIACLQEWGINRFYPDPNA